MKRHRRARHAVWALSIAILTTTTSAEAEDPGDVCSLPGEVQNEMLRLQGIVRACGTEPTCLKRAEEAWRPLLERYPHSFLMLRGYYTNWPAETQAVHRRLNEQRLEATPLDPLALTLHARGFIPDEAEKAFGPLAKALEVDPNYPWAHFTLGWQYANQKDKERARPHALKLAEVCPDSWLSIGLLSTVATVADQAGVAGAMRRVTATLPKDRAVMAYPNVWSTAFRGATAAEHDALRDQIRGDVALLNDWKLEDSREWWAALEKGYQLTNDTANVEAVQAKIAARYPCESTTIQRQLAAWNRQHPVATGEQELERRQSQFAFTTALTGACPDSSLASFARLDAAARLPALSDDQVTDIIQRALEAHDRCQTCGPSPYSLVIDNYLVRRIHLDRVAGLVARERTGSAPPRLERVPAEQRARIERSYRVAEWGLDWRLARAGALQGNPIDEAVAALEARRDAETDLAEKTKLAARLAWLRGDVAAGRGRWADAFGLYHQAAADLKEDALLRVREAAWTRAGGTSEGLAAILAQAKAKWQRSATATDWAKVERRLPEAQLDLVGGGQWSPESLKGRRTLVNLWATWCGPCKAELPLIQKLHERLAGRADIAILTLNLDDNPGLVMPMLRENNYTFPVAFATGYLGESGILPTSWIVDESGIVRMESTGFSPGQDERWIEEALRLLENPTPKPTS